MSKLHLAVAQAMNIEVIHDQEVGVIVPANGSNLDDGWWPIDSWVQGAGIADKLIDQFSIETKKVGCAWVAQVDKSVAANMNRKTAALMAFCRWKRVAYE